MLRDACELLREMWRDGMGRVVLLATVFLGLALAVAAWQEAHDGRRCVEQRFSHYQYIFGADGNIAGMIPVYDCVRYVEDPNS